jgi:DNA/RNA-binding domain of Phe-tRNA-synthetase-like protein
LQQERLSGTIFLTLLLGSGCSRSTLDGLPEMVNVSDAWKTTYANAFVGTLAIRDVANPSHHRELDQRKRALEQQIRERFRGKTKADLAALPIMHAYRAYYKRYRKTYHVLLQLRSVALEQKPIPSVAALVEVMFMAELRNGLLTAVHDLGAVEEPITLSIARGDEAYVLLNGREQTLKPNDMIMSDAKGVICSVLYGSDQRTAIKPETRRAFFVVYAPAGIGSEAVGKHLSEIEADVRIIAPQATTEELRIFGSTGRG